MPGWPVQWRTRRWLRGLVISKWAICILTDPADGQPLWYVNVVIFLTSFIVAWHSKQHKVIFTKYTRYAKIFLDVGPFGLPT